MELNLELNPLVAKNETSVITKEILNNAGRVSDFTLENFFYNMWLNISVATLILAFFTFYR